MKRNKSNNLILLLLVFLFIAPGIAAYLYYQHPQWLGATPTNKGVLLTPPALFKPLSSQSKWCLVLWDPNPCDTACLAQLDQLARIRLALGRRLYKIELWLIRPNHTKPLSKSQSHFFEEQDIHVLQLSKDDRHHFPILKNKVQIFIENPSHYLILAYTPDARSEDIYHDIKKLLD